MSYILVTATNWHGRPRCVSSIPSWLCGFDSRHPLFRFWCRSALLLRFTISKLVPVYGGPPVPHRCRTRYDLPCQVHDHPAQAIGRLLRDPWSGEGLPITPTISSASVPTEPMLVIALIIFFTFLRVAESWSLVAMAQRMSSTAPAPSLGFEPRFSPTRDRAADIS
jgi:hypothetical protein